MVVWSALTTLLVLQYQNFVVITNWRNFRRRMKTYILGPYWPSGGPLCGRIRLLFLPPVVMMMIFICSCRNNNQPNAIYPLGTFLRQQN
jgi:hypothetical protein